jgi:hypothetical protein
MKAFSHYRILDSYAFGFRTSPLSSSFFTASLSKFRILPHQQQYVRPLIFSPSLASFQDFFASAKISQLLKLPSFRPTLYAETETPTRQVRPVTASQAQPEFLIPLTNHRLLIGIRPFSHYSRRPCLLTTPSTIGLATTFPFRFRTRSLAYLYRN